jgi:arsenate reductase-like glutaredoxin family protein
MSNITIYHNPACGTSRNTLEMIRNSGTEPNVIHYLENPPSRDELVKLIADMGSLYGHCCVKMLSLMKNWGSRKINLLTIS